MPHPKEEYRAGHKDGHKDAISAMRRTILQQMDSGGSAAGTFTLGDLNADQLSAVLNFVNSFATR